MIIGTTEFLNLPLEDWWRLVQIAAIVAGATAAYIKWFRGRLYRTRLEISVVGSLIDASPPRLLATARAKNVGLSNVPIKQAGSGLRIFSAIKTPPAPEILRVEWNHEGTFPVFQDHEWIETAKQ
jgi:hypothetical protein